MANIATLAVTLSTRQRAAAPPSSHAGYAADAAAPPPAAAAFSAMRPDMRRDFAAPIQRRGALLRDAARAAAR